MEYLFTTLVSDDLGLLTRTLPIARELTRYGYQGAFCDSAKAPCKLIAEGRTLLRGASAAVRLIEDWCAKNRVYLPLILTQLG